jgi:nitrate reductase delta subunit
MKIYAMLARLLDYPTQELLDNLADARVLVKKDIGLKHAERCKLLAVIDWLSSKSLLRLQEEYVQTFDTAPENCLYVTHHTFGDNRERGPALVELGEHYKAHGFAANSNELPDYLPVMLEFAANLEADESATFIAQTVSILELIAANLEKSFSPYAPLLRFVEARGRLAQATA